MEDEENLTLVGLTPDVIHAKKIAGPSSDASPVEYEYYYEDDYEEPVVTPAPARKKEKAKESNYDIEDLVKAWREYLKEKKSGRKSLLSVSPI